MKRLVAFCLLVALWAWLPVVLFVLTGPRPRVWVVPGIGIYTRNLCGSYDRWMIWTGGLPRWPNGPLGKSADGCILPEGSVKPQ